MGRAGGRDGGQSCNWIHDRDDTIPQPATEFSGARKFAHERSQAGRDALPETSYASVFESGIIDPVLKKIFSVRRSKKQRKGHIDAAPE
jgi:hypothetical protein